MRPHLPGVALALTLLVTTPLAAQELPGAGSSTPGYATFDSVTCVFGAVEGGQPIRTVTIRRGDDAELAWKGEAEPVYLWLEGGRPPLPVWSATVEPSGVVTVQSWTVGGVSDMLTVRPDGPALLSTHDAVSDPEQLVWWAAVGRCAVVQAG